MKRRAARAVPFNIGVTLTRSDCDARRKHSVGASPVGARRVRRDLRFDILDRGLGESRRLVALSCQIQNESTAVIRGAARQISVLFEPLEDARQGGSMEAERVSDYGRRATRRLEQAHEDQGL
jgi:hypothetical protein